MRYFLSVLAAALVFANAPLPSRAWLIQAPGAYTGPGDIHAFTAWGGMRGYSQAKAQAGTTKMAKIRNITTNETCDLLVATTGGLGLTTNCSSTGDNKSPATFCGGTACAVQILYDQTGNNACGGASCDLVQNTTGNQPLIGNFSSNYGEIYFSSATTELRSANNFTPSAAKVSIETAGYRSTGTGFAKFLAGVGSNNFLDADNNVTERLILNGGSSGSITVNAANGTDRALLGVINGASSVLTIQGTDTTGTVTASTSAATPNIGVSAGVGLRMHESGFIDNYAFTSGERTSLTSNIRTWWNI